jgi:hypothetical protein
MTTANRWSACVVSAGLCLSLAASPWSTAAEPPPAEPKPDAPVAAPVQGAEPLKFLEAAAANRGPSKLYTTPVDAAAMFLAALKQKDLNRIAQATALHAAVESKNEQLFRLILAQKLSQEDLDDLASKLSGYQITGTGGPAMNTIKIVVTKPAENGVIRRNLTMRHEKAGWKVQDISGEGLVAEPILRPRPARDRNQP